MTDNVLAIEDAKRAFERAIRNELSGVEGSLRALFERFDAISEHGRGVNGLASAAKGWRKECELLADKIAAEGIDVSKALMGAGAPEITEVVDEALAGAVRARRAS